MKRVRSSSATASAPSLTELVKQLEELLAEAQAVAQPGFRDRPEVGSSLWSGLRPRLLTLRRRFDMICLNARDRVATRARSADQTVRSHPYKAMAAAVGA